MYVALWTMQKHNCVDCFQDRLCTHFVAFIRYFYISTPHRHKNLLLMKPSHDNRDIHEVSNFADISRRVSSLVELWPHLSWPRPSVFCVTFVLPDLRGIKKWIRRRLKFELQCVIRWNFITSRQEFIPIVAYCLITCGSHIVADVDIKSSISNVFIVLLSTLLMYIIKLYL